MFASHSDSVAGRGDAGRHRGVKLLTDSSLTAVCDGTRRRCGVLTARWIHTFEVSVVVLDSSVCGLPQPHGPTQSDSRTHGFVSIRD